MLIFREQYMAMVLQDGPEAPGSAQDLSSTLGKLFDFSFCIFAVGTMQIKSEDSCVRENIYQVIDSLGFAGAISYDWLLLFWLGAWIEKKFLWGYSCVLSLLTLGLVGAILCIVACLAVSLPTFYPHDAIGTRLPQSLQGEISPDKEKCLRCSLKDRITPMWDPWVREFHWHSHTRNYVL